MQFEPLDTSKHNRESFDCEVEALNIYLSRYVKQDEKRSLTRCHVLSDGERIVGYFTLSGHSVSRENLPENRKLGVYEDIPFLLLGRLAIDKEYQGNGYGDALLHHAFKLTKDAAKAYGIYGIIVDAKNEEAASFYRGFGFKPLSGQALKLVLPLSAVNVDQRANIMPVTSINNRDDYHSALKRIDELFEAVRCPYESRHLTGSL